jgi:methylglutaconyl-CoA hydratase
VSDILLSSLQSGVLSLTLNRPAKRNALSTELIEQLHDALERADLDRDVRVVLLRGAGKDFCAGADLDELLASVDRSLGENEAAALRLGSLFQRMHELPKPVIAMVQGGAFAGGAGLATACDLVVAGSGAQLGYPEIQRGFAPAMVMALLRRMVGEKVALDLVLTGRVLSALEAERVGLVSRVVPDAELEQATLALGETLAQSSGSALAFTKRLFYQLDGESLVDGIARGARVNAIARATPDFRNSITQFLKK